MKIIECNTKPVHVTAMQWDGTVLGASHIELWIERHGGDSFWEVNLADKNSSKFGVVTGERDLQVNPGDYIIRGVDGEFYPCTRAVFQRDYEVTSEHHML